MTLWNVVLLTLVCAVSISALRMWRNGLLEKIRTTDGIESKDRLELELNVNSTVATLLGGLGLLAGLFLTTIQVLDARWNAAQELVTDRAANGFALLDNENSPSVRVGGVYVLADLASLEEKYRRGVYSALEDHVHYQSRKSPPCFRGLPNRCANLDRSCVAKPVQGDVQAALDVLIGRKAGSDDTPFDLSASNLKDARLIGSNLSGINLRESDLSGSNLSDADLSEFTNLYCANLYGTELYGIKAQKAELTAASLWGSYLGPAERSGSTSKKPSNLDEAHLDEADLRSARICDASFREASLNNALLDGVEALNTRFERASLVGASFTNAVLSGSDFSDAIALPKESDRNPIEIPRVNLTCAYLAEATPREYCGRRSPPGDSSTVKVPAATISEKFLAHSTLCATTMPDGRLSDRDCPGGIKPPGCELRPETLKPRER